LRRHPHPRSTHPASPGAANFGIISANVRRRRDRDPAPGAHPGHRRPCCCFMGGGLNRRSRHGRLGRREPGAVFPHLDLRRCVRWKAGGPGLADAARPRRRRARDPPVLQRRPHFSRLAPGRSAAGPLGGSHAWFDTPPSLVWPRFVLAVRRARRLQRNVHEKLEAPGRGLDGRLQRRVLPCAPQRPRPRRRCGGGA
jgi:hypothetical protein